MTTCFKKGIVLCLVCFIIAFSLISCKGGIDGDSAKEFIGEFFEALENEDYEKAAEYLHPERPADLETYFLNVEASKDVDFSDGIEIQKYTRVSSSYYDSSVGGSTYELTMKTAVGEDTVIFTVEIVQNEAGYGIYNLEIDK